MKTVKFRLVKDKKNSESPYSIEIKKFGIWVSKRKIVNKSFASTVIVSAYESKKEAIKSLKNDMLYKSKFINYTQYPTIIKS